MELKKLYLKARNRFKDSGFESPEIETRTLLSGVLGLDPHEIYTDPDKIIDNQLSEKFEKSVERRLQGEPSAYITGTKEFFSKEFAVNRKVLIPRAETEILVEESVKVLKNIKKPNILDVGTGSGCIAISVNSKIDSGLICASDLSFEALLTARSNSFVNPGRNKLEFVCGNLLECFKSSTFDIIISNPPYISESELGLLQREIRDFEPLSSLVSKDGGFYHIKRIIENSKIILKQNGWCILETGYNQCEKVEEIFSINGFSNVEIIKDLSGIKRIVKAKWKK